MDGNWTESEGIVTETGWKMNGDGTEKGSETGLSPEGNGTDT